MPDRRALRWLGAVALGYALCLGLSPHPPCIDLPQHVALGAVLRRLWDGDPAALATFAFNPATHNGGLHLLLALGARWLPVELVARLVVAAYPPLLLGGVALALRALGLPAWRALLAVPALLGFSFGWGLVNFCLGTALAFAALGLVVRQLAAPRAGRALVLGALSVVLGLTHVMAMALGALVAGAAALECVLRARGRPLPRRLGRAAFALAPLALGCAYDAWVVASHLAADAGSYATPPPSPAAMTAALGPKVYLFGSLCAGLFRSRLDNAFAWAAAGAVAWLAWAGRGRGAGGDGGPEGDEGAPGRGRGERAPSDPGPPRFAEPSLLGLSPSGAFGPSGAPAGFALAGRPASGEFEGAAAVPPALLAPFALALAAYVATPAVFFNTHLIYQRLAQWVLLLALLAVPPRPGERERRRGPWRLAPALALASLVSAAGHLALYARELGGLDEALGAVPRGARSVGVIEEPTTLAVRMPTLAHAAALAVARGALDDGFGFARWMGFPVVYRPGRRPPPQPSPSWEHDAANYAPHSALGRHYPWVLVRAGREGEADGALLARLFGAEAARVRVVRRAGRWAVLDTRELGGEAAAE